MASNARQLAETPAAALETYAIDKTHSEAAFQIRHLVTKVRGRFGDFEGAVRLVPGAPEKSSVEFSIDAASIDTDVADRDKHLKSADFFDVEKYPTMTFRSTKVAKAGNGALKVTGDLTLHGVTKAVVLDVTTTPEVKGAYGETRRGFAATAKLNRKDFGLTWSKTVEAGPVVGDQVTIALDLEVVKDQPKTAAN